jgi:hypothetical protein
MLNSEEKIWFEKRKKKKLGSIINTVLMLFIVTLINSNMGISYSCLSENCFFDMTVLDIPDLRCCFALAEIKTSNPKIELVDRTIINVTEEHPLYYKKGDFVGWASINPEKSKNIYMWEVNQINTID